MPGVLDRLRQAVQPAARPALGQFGIALVGLTQQRLIGREVDDRVERWVQAVNSRQVGLHHLAAGDTAGVDLGGQLIGVEVGEV